MAETGVNYLVQTAQNRDTMEPEKVRAQLRDLKRQLIGLLTTVDACLGDEPSVPTRAERRRHLQR